MIRAPVCSWHKKANGTSYAANAAHGKANANGAADRVAERRIEALRETTGTASQVPIAMETGSTYGRSLRRRRVAPRAPPTPPRTTKATHPTISEATIMNAKPLGDFTKSSTGWSSGPG